MWRRWLLALLLVVVQIGAQVHAVSHLSELRHDQAPHDEPVCEQCLAYGHIGAALPSTAVSGPEPAPWVPAGPALAITHPSPSAPLYRSRAPPVVSSLNP